MIVERGKEGDSQPAVRQGIQKTMAGRSQKEVNPNGKPTQAGLDLPKTDENHGARKEGSKKK